MFVLDGTMMYIALPHIGADLSFSPATLMRFFPDLGRVLNLLELVSLTEIM